jgi:hypothetical protein
MNKWGGFMKKILLVIFFIIIVNYSMALDAKIGAGLSVISPFDSTNNIGFLLSAALKQDLLKILYADIGYDVIFWTSSFNKYPGLGNLSPTIDQASYIHGPLAELGIYAIKNESLSFFIGGGISYLMWSVAHVTEQVYHPGQTGYETINVLYLQEDSSMVPFVKIGIELSKTFAIETKYFIGTKSVSPTMINLGVNWIFNLNNDSTTKKPQDNEIVENNIQIPNQESEIDTDAAPAASNYADLMQQANNFYNKKNYVKALEVYQSAYDTNPNDKLQKHITLIKSLIQKQKNKSTGPGYKGIPWGTDLEDFKDLAELRKYDFNEDNPSVMFTGDDSLIAEVVLFGLKDCNYMPNNFSYIDDRNEDYSDYIYYLFYNHEFAGVLQEFANDELKDVKNKVNSKYKFINGDTIYFETGIGGANAPNTFSVNYSVYENKQKTFKIYVIKSKAVKQDFNPFDSKDAEGNIKWITKKETSLFVIYISNKYLNQIKSDIGDIKSENKRKEQKEKRKKEDKINSIE